MTNKQIKQAIDFYYKIDMKFILDHYLENKTVFDQLVNLQQNFYNHTLIDSNNMLHNDKQLKQLFEDYLNKIKISLLEYEKIELAIKYEKQSKLVNDLYEILTNTTK